MVIASDTTIGVDVMLSNLRAYVIPAIRSFISIKMKPPWPLAVESAYYLRILS